jgi:regulator of protease activity HflC (stomatin/prohibitin superfamily)
MFMRGRNGDGEKERERVEVRQMDSVTKWAIGIGVFVVALVLFVVLNPIVIISPGERGVVITLGAVEDKILNEGLHFRTPFVQGVAVMNVQIQKDEVETGAASKDLQELKTTIALNYHLEPTTVNTLYQKIGLQYKVRVIDPAIQESVKAATAKYTAEEAITKRSEVRDTIKQLVTVRLAKEFIIVDEVSITDFDFSKSFNDAIEAKVTAEQEALQAKNVLEKVKFQAEQRVAQATAEAEAIRIQAESISKQGGESYVQLKAIERWDGKLPQQFVPGSAVPFLDLNQKKPQ